MKVKCHFQWVQCRYYMSYSTVFEQNYHEGGPFIWTSPELYQRDTPATVRKPIALYDWFTFLISHDIFYRLANAFI